MAKSSAKTTGDRVPTRVWGSKETRDVAEWVQECVYGRVFGAGKGSDDNPLPPKKDGSASFLTDSGELKAGFRVLKTAELNAEVGVTGPSLAYADATETARPWLALSPSDLAKLETRVAELIRRRVEAQGGL